MEEEIDIKEELDSAEEEWDIKEETKWQFTNVKEANSNRIEEDEKVPLTFQTSCWKREIDDDEVNEELEQKFVCGFPSDVAETSSDVEELIPKESNPLLIDRSYEYTTLRHTSTNQSYLGENLMDLQPLVVQDTSLTSNSHEDENLALSNLKPAEVKSPLRRCPVCKEFLNSLSDLKNHSLDHAEVWPYNCAKCNKVFIYRSSFDHHMNRQHGVNRTYVCKVCKMTFEEDVEFHNHKFVHNRKRSFSCPICNKAFTRNYDCLLHMKKLHEVLRPYKCSTCKETFRLSWDLQRHMSGHHGDRPENGKFSCDTCGKSFALRARLIKHFVSHSNDRPYPCTLCNKSFKSKATLWGHTMWHTGKRRYNCTACGKAFINTSCLKKHTLLHSQDRQNVCEVCGKSFRRNFYLRQHKLKHEKDLPSFAAI